MIDCNKREDICRLKTLWAKLRLKLDDSMITSSVLLSPQNPLQAINTESMTIYISLDRICNRQQTLTYAVFRLERATEVLELTYLGKYFACVNAN